MTCTVVRWIGRCTQCSSCCSDVRVNLHQRDRGRTAHCSLFVITDCYNADEWPEDSFRLGPYKITSVGSKVVNVAARWRCCRYDVIKDGCRSSVSLRRCQPRHRTRLTCHTCGPTLREKTAWDTSSQLQRLTVHILAFDFSTSSMHQLAAPEGAEQIMTGSTQSRQA